LSSGAAAPSDARAQQQHCPGERRGLPLDRPVPGRRHL